MKKIKVTVTKLGKRISFKGLSLSSPCKFFINEKDKTHFEVLMKQNGIQKKEYFFGEAKEQSKAIKEANAKAKEQAVKSNAELVKAMKEQDKVAPKVEAKPEPKKEAPKHNNNNKKHNKKN